MPSPMVIIPRLEGMVGTVAQGNQAVATWVEMVKTLFASHGAGQDETIFKFAADVEVDQSTEIRRMLQMLIEAPSTPPQRN